MTNKTDPEALPQAGLFVVPKQGEQPEPPPPADFVAVMAEILARVANEKAA